MNKLKKIISICLVFVMVLGMLGSSIPTNATDSINATITGIMKHDDSGLIVLKIASDQGLLTETLTGEIKVGGTINPALSLNYNCELSATESQYLIYAGAQEVGTKVEFGGTFTTTSGKTVNIPQTTLEWTGSLWVCVATADAVNATVGNITQPERSDTLIVIDIESDKVLPSGGFTGKIRVGETDKEVSLVLNVDTSATSKNYFFDPGVKDTNTLVVLSGVFFGANGKISIAETTFQYTGTKWEKYVAPVDATVVENMQPERSDGLVVLKVESDSEPLTESLTGDIKIKVGETVKNESSLTYNGALNAEGTQTQYLISISELTAGTQVEFGGTFTTASGKKVNIPQTTWEWNGSLWACIAAADAVDATVGEITQPERSDTLIVMDIESDKVLPGDAQYDVFTGKIKVGETEKKVDLVLNTITSDYSKNYYIDPGVKDTNTPVVLSGVFTSAKGKINIAETTFKYTGTKWEKYVAVVDATVVENMQPERSDGLVVLKIESDSEPLTESLTGDIKIKVGETVKNESSLTYNGALNAEGTQAQYLISISELTAGTQVEFGGTFTTASGKKVNIPQTTWEWNGSLWACIAAADAVDATVGEITQPERSDTLIVMDIESDKVLPGDAQYDVFTGKIKVGETEKKVDLVLNAITSDYSKNYYIDPGVKDTNTLVVLSGVFTSAKGKINIAETTFKYTGTKWEVYCSTANATFGSFYGQDIPDKHVRMIVTTDDTFVVNTTLTGTFQVDDVSNTSLVLRKVGEFHYAIFTNEINVVEGTKIKLGGIYTTTDGRKVNFAEVTFVYHGADWQIDYPIANATYRSLYGQDIGDKHIRIVVETDDVLADNTMLTGEFYVDGKINTSLELMKAGSVNYAILTGGITVKEGTRIKLGGLYTATDGRKVNFAEVTFIYNGTNWEIDYPTAQARFVSLYGLDIADKHVRMTVTTEDTLPLNTFLTGKFYVDGKENTSLRLMKSGDYHYAILTDSITVQEGTKIKLGGIYRAPDGRKVNFAEVTFIYNGTNWEVVYPTAKANFSALYGQEIEDKHIRMIVTTDDTLPLNTFLTGKFYVDGNENTNLQLMKAGEFHYAIFTDSITVKEGTTIKIDGVYKAADGRKVDFEKITFKYDGGVWTAVYDGQASKATDINVIHHHLTDTFIRFNVKSDDTIRAYDQISGKIYVDGKLRTDVVLMKDAEGFYVVLLENAPAGTVVKIEGVYMAASGAVEMPFTEFKYNGTDWGVLYPGTASKAEDLQLIHHHLTDTFIRFNVKSNDTIGTYESMFGDIYVNGELRVDVQMFKDPEGFFAILLEEAPAKTSVKINGVFRSQSGAIELPSTEFIYNGMDWVVAYKGKVEKADNLRLVNQSLTDYHIRFRVDSEDTIGVYEVILGDIYVDGKIRTDVSMMKSSEGGFYAIFLDEASAGTIVKIGGVYMSDSGAVKMPITEFIYDGQSWGIVFRGTPPKLDVAMILDHNNMDLNIRMNVTGENIVGVNAKITGDIYVNGQLNPDVKLTKYSEGYYMISMEEAVVGTVVTIGGTYNTYATSVEFPSIDMRYDGANWGIIRYGDVHIKDLKCDELDGVLVRYRSVYNEQKDVDLNGDDLVWKMIILVCSIGIVGILIVTGVITWKRKGNSRLE